MTRNWILWLCGGLSLCLLAVAAPATLQNSWGIVGADGVRAPLEVSRSTPEYTSIALNNAPVETVEMAIGFETLHAFQIQGEPFLMKDGSPAVPEVTRFYRIPNTGRVELVIRAAEFELIENIDPLPLQLETMTLNGARKAEVYGRDAWYPATVAELSDPAIMRDFRVASVSLYPVQVNPVTHQARIYHRLEVEIVAADGPSENELLNPRPILSSWVPLYRDMIPNLDETALDETIPTPGSYLIIYETNAQMQSWVDSLVLWKTRKGFAVQVASNPNWTAQSMVSVIQNAYATFDPPLEYVCLMGDPSAAFGVPTNDQSSYPPPYDHSFALGNANDQMEDIAVGRLSGSNNTEMATINAKIMGYERTPWMEETDWFQRGFFYAGVNEESFAVTSNYQLMLWAAHSFSTWTGVTDAQVAWYNGQSNCQLLSNIMEEGISFMFWRGSWGGEMGPGCAAQTNPGFQLPVVLTVTCGAGEFVGGMGVSESFLLAGTPTSPRGGICGIGSATIMTHPPQNICLSGGLAYSISNVGIEHVGTALVAAKYWLHRTFGMNSEDAVRFSGFNNLMGDPGLSMWTDVPVVMEADHPISVSVGAKHIGIDLNVDGTDTPIADALVVLWKGTETFARVLTDAAGHADLAVDIQTAGDLLLTITKQNHKPYLATLPCLTAGENVSFGSWTVDDDNTGGTVGNGDGVINNGETVDLLATLHNHGTANTATNVHGLLSSPDPRVTVLAGSVDFADAAPGANTTATAAMRIRVAPTVQNEECLPLLLDVQTAITGAVSQIDLICAAPEVRIESVQAQGVSFPGSSNGVVFSITNSGQSAIINGIAELISLSRFVSVDDGECLLGTLPIGGTAGNAGGDELIISSMSVTPGGHQAAMLLLIHDSNGFVDSLQFTLNIGSTHTSDPTGPDAYGYYCYDNTDVAYEMHPDFSYVDISSGLGTNLQLNDAGNQTTALPITSTVRVLPFPFTFYGQTYDSVTICSNGWLSFGNDTYFCGWKNYPIPSMQAPEAMVAAYWDDLMTQGAGLGVWHYFDVATHRYVVQWKASGAYQVATLNFEVILYDEEFYPTLDGNGKVEIQYETVTLNLMGANQDQAGCGIGIQAPRGLVGLECVYGNTHAPGMANIANRRSILFTTTVLMAIGNVTGQVTELNGGSPIDGVTVEISGSGLRAVTNAAGQYLLPGVPAGRYALIAHKVMYNDAVLGSVTVTENETTTANLTMTRPECSLSDDSLSIDLGTGVTETSFTISNSGNGPLDYSIELRYGSGESVERWSRLENVDVSAITQDFQIQGCEFVDGEWWVSGSGGPGGANLLYRFDAEQNYLGSIPQPTTGSGWMDLAWDGQYLYGSDGANLVGVTREGVVGPTIPTPLNPCRGVAYDPATDHFWIADYTQDFYEINRAGETVRRVLNESVEEVNATGLAWYAADPSACPLYVFSQDGSSSMTELSRVDPGTGWIQTIAYALTTTAGDRAGGLTITSDWNSSLLALGSVIQNAAGDHLEIFLLEVDLDWLTVSPQSDTLAPGTEQVVSISVDPEQLQPNVYHTQLRMTFPVLDSTYVLPLTVTQAVSVQPPEAPVTVTEYALYPNYPNPFNPQTTIRYDLAAGGMTTLTVYNLLGQKIASPVHEIQQAGRHELSFDAGALPSGVYLYRIESGEFSQSGKMMLLK